VTYFIFEKTFKELEFFRNRPVSLIAWICPLLRPMIKSKDEYIFFEDDDVTCIYFFQKGQAGYILPRHKNLMYINLSKGKQFGIICILGHLLNRVGNFEIDNWINYKGQLKRQNTIQCKDQCEMLTLTIQDLSMMKNELYEAYTDAFNNSLNIL